LHNEAKYLEAKLAVKQKIQHDPQTEGCTFQPQLVTDPKITKRMVEIRAKSMEARDSLLQQSLTLAEQRKAWNHVSNQFQMFNFIKISYPFLSIFYLKIQIRSEITANRETMKSKLMPTTIKFC
jgi:hypothetical protein